ncbi:uncharacterized protein [Typha latifolia]|uniref:uncharacterized protein n=1 Tax=Typha latifolia TaxID=4733 RepID=UPI003C301938
MAAFVAGKMKRKDVEEVNNDFSEFSLCSPARKIRRLDADLPPIMEEEQLPSVAGIVESVMDDDSVPTLPSNEERALVLYKPVDAQLLIGPSQSNVSFRVSSDLIHGFKNQILHQGMNHSQFWESKPSGVNNCLAVVPWVSPHKLQNEIAEEEMESEGAQGTSMEIEEDIDQAAPGGGNGGDCLHQWQQHCMNPQLLATNPSTPIMW